MPQPGQEAPLTPQAFFASLPDEAGIEQLHGGLPFEAAVAAPGLLHQIDGLGDPVAARSAARADALRARHPGVLAEAMEGFGVAEAAALYGLPVLEVRAVSNPVGPRDRDAWRIGAALAALTGAFGKFTPVIGKLAPVLESWNRHD